MSSLRPSTFLTDAFGALMVRAVGIVMMFASTTVTARLLGPAEYGAFSSALALAMFLAALAPLGSDRLLSRNLSTVSNDLHASAETSVTLACLLRVIAVLLFLSLATAAAGTMFSPESAWTQTLSLSAILSVPLSLMYLRQWVAIPLHGARNAMIAEQTLQPLCFAIAMLGTAILRLPLTAVTAAFLHIIVVSSLLSLIVMTGSLRGICLAAIRAVRQVSWMQVRERIRQGIPFAAVSIGGVASQTCLPVVIAGSCGFQNAGFFALAQPWAAIPAIPLGVFNLSLLSSCARHYHNREFAQASHCVRRAATITFLLAATISAGLWFGRPLLVQILGVDYAATSTLLPWLLLATVVDSLTGPTVPVMQTMGMESFYTRAILLFLPLQFAIISLAGSMSGLEGAAAGYLMSRCLWNVTVVIRIYQDRGLLMLPYLYPWLAAVEDPGSIPMVNPKSWSSVADDRLIPPTIQAA